MKWFNGNDLKLTFVRMLTNFKAVDTVIGEVYDNMEGLADSINDGKLKYNSASKYLEVGFYENEENQGGGQ